MLIKIAIIDKFGANLYPRGASYGFQ
jgi:hypothetical protein